MPPGTGAACASTTRIAELPICALPKTSAKSSPAAHSRSSPRLSRNEVVANAAFDHVRSTSALPMVTESGPTVT